MSVTVAFACNDARHGYPLGKFNALDIRCGDIDLRLQGPLEEEDGVPIEFDFKVMGGEGTVKIADRVFHGHNWQNWYGNWCWDAISLPWPDALDLINFIAKLPDWHCEEGPCALFDALELRSEITPLEWRREFEA